MSYLEGHRQRLRDRFNTSGLGAFEDHEVLELLLTYEVPRKDVKPIAHALLERLGSLSNALGVSSAELVKVEGVSETGDTRLHLMPALPRHYLRNRWGARPQLSMREELAQFVVNELATAMTGVFLLVWHTRENHVLRSLALHEDSITSAPVYPCLVVEAALRHRATKVVFAHNYPGGVAQHSEDDVAITRTLVGVRDALAIPVVDHLVVSGPRIFSMADAGLLRVPPTTAPSAVGGAT
jgi:DNA repair protein RadC